MCAGREGVFRSSARAADAAGSRCLGAHNAAAAAACNIECLFALPQVYDARALLGFGLRASPPAACIDPFMPPLPQVYDARALRVLVDDEGGRCAHCGQPCHARCRSPRCHGTAAAQGARGRAGSCILRQAQCRAGGFAAPPSGPPSPAPPRPPPNLHLPQASGRGDCRLLPAAAGGAPPVPAGGGGRRRLHHAAQGGFKKQNNCSFIFGIRKVGRTAATSRGPRWVQLLFEGSLY